MFLPDWVNAKVVAWGAYDFADQAFQALFITFLFPIFVVEHLSGTELHVGLVASVSVLIAALLVPWLGAVSDLSGRRLPILFWTAVATGGLGVLVGYAPLGPALILAFLARVSHYISKSIYDAKMIEVTDPPHFGTLSGIGMAFGYSGAIASLVVAYFLFERFGWDQVEGIRAVFWMSAIWYVVFLIPMLIILPDADKKPVPSFSGICLQACRGVAQTLRSLPQSQTLGRFLAASFLYNNAMATVVIFLALYGMEEANLTMRQFFPVYGVMALFSGMGAIGFGRAADHFRPPRVIRFCLLVWILLIIVLMFWISYPLFFMISAVGGLVFGGIWTLNRHMIADIAEAANIAKIFGFEGLTSRLSGLFGPAIFGALAVFHSYSLALISVLFFFIAGWWVMRKL